LGAGTSKTYVVEPPSCPTARCTSELGSSPAQSGGSADDPVDVGEPDGDGDALDSVGDGPAVSGSSVSGAQEASSTAPATPATTAAITS
jgi:hypothetical protein